MSTDVCAALYRLSVECLIMFAGLLLPPDLMRTSHERFVPFHLNEIVRKGPTANPKRICNQVQNNETGSDPWPCKNSRCPYGHLLTCSSDQANT